MRKGPRSVRLVVLGAAAVVAGTTALSPAMAVAGTRHETTTMVGTATPATGGQAIAFGADLKPAKNQTLQQTIASFETTTGRKLAYTRDYLLWDSPFPTDYEEWLGARGTVPFISVSPHTMANATISWSSIANATPGTPVYAQMVAWADEVKAFGYPIYFTFNHEPEAAASTRYGTAPEFIAAWQNFHRVFDAEQVTNARWIWTMTAYAFTVTSSDPRWGPYWYPGDAYVDALGADAYTAYTCDNPGGIWHNLAYQIAGFTAFGAQHPTKPLWLPEWGVVEDSHQAGRKAQFITEAQALFKGTGYQQYAGIAYFDETRPGTACVWDVTSSTTAQTAYNTMARDAFYSGSAAWTPADTTPPTVSITSPSSGTTITSPTTVTATATDNAGVASVAFSVDGSLLATDTTAPYLASVDPATLSPGNHTVLAVARDAANNATTSAPITLTVPPPNPDTTPPTVAMTAPTDRATVSGSVSLAATASDDSAVASVSFAVDGTSLSTDTTAPYTGSLNTTTLALGTHTLTATAMDASNNTATSAPITVTVTQRSPDTAPPTVSITSPADGSTISGTTAVTATAADNVAVASVGFFADGTLISTDTSAPYSASIDTTTWSSGAHTLTAMAADTSANKTTSAVVNVTVLPSTPPPTQCAAAPAGSTELSTNLSLETNQNGWTGVYNSTSVVTRAQVSGGSYDGGYALQIGPKSGTSGVAGLNNVPPFWVANTVANRTYTGSAVVRSAVSGLPVTILLRETTASGTGIAYASKTITLSSTGWQPISVAYLARNAGDQIRYSLYATFPNSGTSMLGDCLSLQSTP